MKRLIALMLTLTLLLCGCGAKGEPAVTEAPAGDHRRPHRRTHHGADHRPHHGTGAGLCQPAERRNPGRALHRPYFCQHREQSGG